MARGKDALPSVVADPAIDILIVDLALPDMNGADLVAKASGLRQGLRVIFASGHSAKSIDLDPEKVRFVFLSKPYDTRQLSEALAKLA